MILEDAGAEEDSGGERNFVRPLRESSASGTCHACSELNGRVSGCTDSSPVGQGLVSRLGCITETGAGHSIPRSQGHLLIK